eukprot:3400580-Heterocapsa_arctica.AAC.1
MSATADDPLQRQDKTPRLSSIHMTLAPRRTCDSWKRQNKGPKASPCAMYVFLGAKLATISCGIVATPPLR